MKPIYLKLSVPTDKLATGSSRFWGNPDLPEDFDYPSYIDEDGEEYDYDFVCQINPLLYLDAGWVQNKK